MRRWSFPWVRPTLPPALDAVFQNRLDELRNPDDVRRAFERGLQRTIIRETEWAKRHFPYKMQRGSFSSSTPFTIIADVETTPFGPFTEVCSRHSCRADSALKLATSLGLYADSVVVPDEFSRWFVDGVAIDWETMTADLLALHEMRPLIADGTIIFSSPDPKVCPNCFRKYEIDADEACSSLAEHLRPYLTITTKDAGRIIRIRTDIPDCNIYDFEFHYTAAFSGSDVDTEGLNLFANWLARRARRDYVPRQLAHEMKGVLISDDILHLLQIQTQHDVPIDVRDLATWQAERSIQLPWLSDLSVAQISQLRQEADRALPRLRDQLAAWATDPKPENFTSRLLELRDSVFDLDVELDAINRKRKSDSDSHFSTIVGGSTLTFALYGVATGFVAPASAVATLLGFVGVLHSFDRTDEYEENKLKGCPAYAMLRAKQILREPRNR